jgi:rhodanese-related sulfurtransferase
MDKVINVTELKDKMDSGKTGWVLLDVREPEETRLARIEGALCIPMSFLMDRMSELKEYLEKEIYCLCHHGGRSAMVADFLNSNGFRAVNVLGGINAWTSDIDPTVPRY